MKKSNDIIEVTEIIPISRKIGKKEALNIVKVACKEDNFLGKGHAGSVYIYRKKYAIKKSDKYFNEEVKALIDLNMAIDEGLDIGNSQKGICAFKTNEKDVQGYLISTFVEGCNAYDLPEICMSQKHFENILKLILNMDLGTINKNNLELLYMFLHYDLSPSNILLTDNEAGLVDFEMLKREDLDVYFFKRQIYNCKYNLYDDTVTFPSNLRLFEICFIWLYFISLTHEHKDLDKKTISKVFNDYLLAKAKYLLEQSKIHKKISEHQGLGKELLKRVSDEEIIHSRLISADGQNIPDDIRRAEIYKIQLANFYFQVQVHFTGIQNIFDINIVKEYKKEKELFYKNQLEISNNREDKDRIIYYTNCIKFLNKFVSIDDLELANKDIPMFKNIPTLDEMIL